jgi:LPS export ABC transporter permease LptG/LPS export ABC transporter permease LptF
MLRTLDRYVIREIIPPFLLSLLVFTFILEIPPVMDSLEALVAKGVPWSTAGRILLTLVPQALGLTIPMALLVGMLIGLGRLSADREAMALLACGVSPYRLLRPIGLLAVLGTAATMYVMIVAIPDANQTFREITFDIISKRVENDIRPRVFFEDFPGWVLYARDEPPPGQPGWKDVLVANTTKPEAAEIYFASRGRVVLDRARRRVDLVLTGGTSYKTPKPGESAIYRFPADLVIQLDANSVFQRGELPRGITEQTIAQLREQIDQKVRNHISPHPEIMAIHAKFSIPVACLVFAVIALALGLTVAREGKLAGFVVGIGVIFTYYVVMFLSESMAKGQWMPAALARWVPNIVLGPLGVAALVWRARFADRGLPRLVPLRLPWVSSGGDLAAAPTQGRSARGAGRVVLVVRVPRFWTPAPGILDRYISRLYGRVVALSFLALLGLFYISTFIDKSDKLFKGQASTLMVLKLLVYMTPQFVYYIIPLSALLSVLITFGLLTRNSELTVMKACGISLYRTSVAVVVLSLVFSAILYGMEQQLLARANRRAEILDAQIRGRPPRVSNIANRRWIVGKDGAVYHYAYFDPDQNALNALTIYRPRADRWALASTTYVNRALYRGGWQADRGWTQEYESSRPKWEAFGAQPLVVAEAPDYFEAEQPLPDMMTVAQLRREVAELSASGFNYVPLAVELQRKLAFPFVTLVMTLLAVPFGVTAGRRGTVYGVGLGVVIALAYWIAFSAFIAVGKAGLLSPALAAWAPNIIVLGGAAYLFLTART